VESANHSVATRHTWVTSTYRIADNKKNLHVYLAHHNAPRSLAAVRVNVANYDVKVVMRPCLRITSEFAVTVPARLHKPFRS